MNKNTDYSMSIAEARVSRGNLLRHSRPLLVFFVMAIAWPSLTIPAWSSGHGARWGNSSLRFSSDGKLVAFAFGEGSKIRPVRLIDLETGAIIKTFPVGGAVSDLSFSPNGYLLAASITLNIEPPDGVIRVWNIHTGEEIGHTDTPNVFHIDFLKDNKTVAYDNFGEIELWNIKRGKTKKTGQELKEVNHSADFPNWSVAGSREKGIYVTAERKEAAPVVIRITETDRIIEQLPMDGTVQSLFFDYGGETLAVLVQNGKIPIQLWDTNTWTLRQSFYPESPPVEGTFSRDGKFLAVHLEDNTLRIWDLNQEKAIKSVSFLLPNEKFLEAAERGDLGLLKTLISEGIDIKTTEFKYRRSAMLIAAAEGHLNVVRFLHEAGVDLSEEDSLGFTAIMLAVMGGKTDIVQYLLSADADIDMAEALYRAATGGHTDTVQALLRAGADANASLPGGSHVLVGASQWSDNPDTVRVLLDAGADVNAKDPQGWTALSGAASWGHTEILKVLLQAGADVDTRGYENRTALMVAAIGGNTDIAALLLEAGANVNSRDKHGKSALMYAREYGKTDMIDLLLETGATE